MDDGKVLRNNVIVLTIQLNMFKIIYVTFTIMFLNVKKKKESIRKAKRRNYILRTLSIYCLFTTEIADL